MAAEVGSGGWASCHAEMEGTMKKGMAPESVEQMGQQIQQVGEDAQRIFQQIADRVQSFDWTGEDRDRYVSEFSDALGQMVQQVVQQCGDFSNRASQNASQQREASS